METLVVFSIVAVLASLLFPAIQAARESARQVDCANRLAQVVKGALAYESAKQCFPPGTLGFEDAYPLREDDWDVLEGNPTCWRRAQYTSSFGLMLPFLEDGSRSAGVDPIIFNEKRFSLEPRIPSTPVPAQSAFYAVTGYAELVQTEPAGFRCPTDKFFDREPQDEWVSGALQPVTLATGPYRLSVAHYVTLHDVVTGRVGITSYLGCLGANSGGGKLPWPDLQPFIGMMSTRKGRKIAKITDGLAHTIAFGETLGEMANGVRSHSQSWLCGGLGRGHGDVEWMQTTTENRRLIGSPVRSFWVGFGSGHVGGALVAFADGHVATVSRQIDWRPWYGACGIQDGISVSVSEIE